MLRLVSFFFTSLLVFLLCKRGKIADSIGYHPSSTCAMGPSSNPNAVLDSRLRVRGVRGLRVADVSSIPRVNNGHTQMVAYGVGEGAAEMIKEDALADRAGFLKLTA